MKLILVILLILGAYATNTEIWSKCRMDKNCNIEGNIFTVGMDGINECRRMQMDGTDGECR